VADGHRAWRDALEVVVSDGLPDPVEPRGTPSLPIARPVSMHSMAPQIPLKPGWLVLGIAIAFAGHLFVAGGSFALLAYGTTDPPLFGGIYAVLLEVMSFGGCVGGGSRLMDRNRGLGLGLIIGWLVGLVALVIAVLLVAAPQL
jgi:hypothetical protein